ncbi:hypothetical protein GCM10010357_19890 [Streptomyces luteireticuli]|uniref:Secreted protein n=1 Tax=Streptomyces luteireticuli TaxID=173858 RepID=A0ABN0YKN3_9ACTN
MRGLPSLSVAGIGALLVLGGGGGLFPMVCAAGAPYPKGSSVAAPPGNASYSATDLRSGRSRKGTSRKGTSRSAERPGGRSGAQADGLVRGPGSFPTDRSFQITCDGSRWFVFVDCTDGFRYTFGPFSGALRVTAVCPLGARATGGGAFATDPSGTP